MSWIYGLSGPRRAGHLRLPDRRAVQAGEILMSANGWLQLALYVVVLLLLAKPLGAYMARSTKAARRAPSASAVGSSDCSTASPASIPRSEMGWKEYAIAMLCSTSLGLLVVYALQRAAAVAAAQSAGLRARSAPDSSFNTGVELRHQHQLAGLRRRDDDELPHADAGADGAELRLGGDRHGGAGRADSRLRAQGSADASATSGSI